MPAPLCTAVQPMWLEPDAERDRNEAGAVAVGEDVHVLRFDERREAGELEVEATGCHKPAISPSYFDLALAESDRNIGSSLNMPD